ncbi:MAG: hypothetical protein HKN91_01325 [Acidimicrobiia bacterium]|nr:hypothetical protein [Acidimicrobiia bacterium]
MSDAAATIEALLESAASEHHAVFDESDGADPEWPLWYASYLVDRLRTSAGFAGTRSELVYWLVRLDKEYGEADSAIPWPRFYAARLAAL